VGKFLAGIIVVFATATAARAVLIEHSTAGYLFYDGFETSLSGELPNSAVWTTAELSGDSIRVTDAAPAGGAFLDGNCLAINVQNTGGGTQTATTYAQQTSGTLHFEWMLYPLSGSAQPYSGGGSTPGFVMEDAYLMAGSYASDLLAVSDHAGGAGWFTTSVSVPKDQWNKLEVNYDLDAHKYEVVVNGNSTGWLQKFYPTGQNWFNCPTNAFLTTDLNRLGVPYYIDASKNIAEEPQEPSAALEQMLVIDWHKGTSLPHGYQDAVTGKIGNTLLSIGGFCQGQYNVPGKEDKYPRGFFKNVWGLDLGDSQATWQKLPDFPGAGRQCSCAINVGESLYCWGGFSYDDPYCYKDGYRLSQSGGDWTWDALPDLPSECAAAGITAIGSKIYVFGGSDYDTNRFTTNSDCDGQVQRLGARLLVLDTDNLTAGWQELTSCPGTPRWVAGVAAVDDTIYVIGGASGNDNASDGYCTVVDNWSYDPATDTWTRLADLPISSGNFPNGAIVFEDRYLVLVGGYQYANVLGPDGEISDPYGTVTKHYPAGDYNSDVFVYDTLTGEFGTATPLPLNNNMPTTMIVGNQIHMIGGEIGGAEIEGELFGHHPDLYLVGDIRSRKPGDTDLNGVIDQNDAAVLAGNWLVSGENVTWAMGDFNGDNIIDDKDAALLAANWTGNSTSASAPEPGVVLLLLSVLPLLVLKRMWGRICYMP